MNFSLTSLSMTSDALGPEGERHREEQRRIETKEDDGDLEDDEQDLDEFSDLEAELHLFLKDNGFSDKASRAENTYLKDLPPSEDGKLHAHLKVTFANDLSKCSIHGTIRSAQLTEALSTGFLEGEKLEGKRLDDAIAKAIWVDKKGEYKRNIDAKALKVKQPDLTRYIRSVRQAKTGVIG